MKKPTGTTPPSEHFLTVRCAKFFETSIRKRGESYFRSGLVSKPSVSSNRISAFVNGSKKYNVNIDWEYTDPDEILITCTCPYYSEGMFCKHAWALIATIDYLHLHENIPGKKSLFIIHKLDRKAYNHKRPDEGILVETIPPEPKFENNPWLEKIRALQRNPTELNPFHAITLKTTSQKKRRAYYALDIDGCRQTGLICVHFCHQEFLNDGTWSPIKFESVSKSDLADYVESEDRALMALLLHEGDEPRSHYSYSQNSTFGDQRIKYSKAKIPFRLQTEFLSKMVSNERLFRPVDKYSKTNLVSPVKLDLGPPWKLRLIVKSIHSSYTLSGQLFREQFVIDLQKPLLLMASGLIIFEDHIARLEVKNHFPWMMSLRQNELPLIPFDQIDDLIQTLHSDNNSPPVEWPEDLKWPLEITTVVPMVVIESALHSKSLKLKTELRFRYNDFEVSLNQSNSILVDINNRKWIERNASEEQRYLETLKTFEGLFFEDDIFSIERSQFTKIIDQLIDSGWTVRAFNKIVKKSGHIDVKVASGIDWFDLSATINFDGIKLTLPQLLEAIESGENFISLGNGAVGMLPSDWLKKYSALGKIGKSVDSKLRFTKSQGALVAAWLGEESLSADKEFSNLIEALRSRVQLRPQKPQASFNGELRTYQKEGLSWLTFLSKVGFGGILADDMGLGKTVQVLAHLDSEYTRLKKETHKPTLIIVPKSLLFNWRDEAEKFSPSLKVIIYAGSDRGKHLKTLFSNDIILITYSTLRQDIERFSNYEFHYVIADEAQYIKNVDSQAHQACRSLRAKHKLAMTGTPIENSVLDLIAILDFVSPGLLGEGVRRRMTKASSNGDFDMSSLTQLSKALQPFILRRTKDQVLKDLPSKTEKIINCELSASETKRYRELADYYRLRLKKEFSNHGVAKSKIVVLEALLRLRQAACHPGLIDKKCQHIHSTKTETLIEHLKELTSRGHKALVFSQFTSFLDIVSKKLKDEDMLYFRLDGKTSNMERQELVKRFQTESEMRIFLISLKAGGVGLNLTAADYVFILDPWWNPAAEAQAIDRTHRIGQKNKVIAYRLIAKDTVEEKIIELQKKKRGIADAIISEDASLLKKLTPADIEILLS